MSKGAKKKGFALVELVVVLAIFGLLASITGLGLYSWTRYSINKENNENARTIFLAAQESLTHMQASGTLDSIDLTYVEKTKVEQIKQQNVGMDFTNFDKFSGRLYTAIYMPTNKSGIVYNLLKPYLEGTGILDGAIAIEFDPKDGVVYSVFYSKKATSFEYETDGNINESGVIGICKRDSGTLKDRLLGYYVADLTAAKPIETPVVYFESVEGSKDVQLVNEEELYYRIPFSSLNITDSNKLFLKKSTYKISIYEKNGTSSLITLDFSGESFDKVNNVINIEAKYKTKQNGNQSAKVDIKLKYLVINSELRIFFDSIDVNTVKLLSTSNIQFQGSSTTFSHIGNHFVGTYGIFNLIQEVEKNQNHSFDIDFLSIFCKSEVSIDGDTFNFDSSDTHNYLYDNMTIDGNTIKVEISNIRHLFNICYLEKINNSASYTIKYIQTKDIEYDGKYVFSTVNNHTGVSDVNSFPTIQTLGSNSTYDAKDESGVIHSISNLKLDSLILTSYNSNSMYSKCLGIFAENNGTIKNLKLTDVELNSSLNPDGQYNVESTSYQYGSGAISGLNSGVIDNCEVSGEIIGNVNIGGIAGVNYSKIKDCVSKVLVKALNSNSYNLGGIAGFSVQKKNTGGYNHQTVPDSIIENCTYIATNTITLDMLNQSSNPFTEDLKGTHIGGIVGRLIDGTEVRNCHSKTANEGYLIGYGSVGGIVGRTDNDSKITSEINNGQRLIYNSINVIGVDRVGGVVANIAIANETTKTFENLENRGAIVVMSITGPNGEPIGSYGGGITAYLPENTTLKNCLSNIDIDYEETEDISIKELLLVKFSKGNSVGGLVGQQRGIIISDSIVEHKVLVGGGDNVGGLVGDNDINSNAIPTLKKQKISAGIILGNDYVGGLIGYNTKVISDDSNINHTINRIIGDNYVGGIVGYNIKEYKNKYNNNTNVSISQQQISVESITGDTFVGGLVGLNEGAVSNNNDAENSIESVVGNSHVGALVGKNEPEAKISQNYISNITIKANGSFVGGLAGENQGEITLHNIKTINNIKINNEATENNQYTGGLAGSNSGLITNFNIADASIVSKGSYVGGATGSNALNGSISNIGNITSINVEGVSYTGGLAGENNGDISTFSIYSGKIHASGEYSGGLCGKNNGTIKNTGTVINNLEVSGTNYVGGLTGYNNKYRSTESEEYNTKPNIYCNTVNGKVIGNGKYIGGLAGYNQGYIKSDSAAEVTVEVNNNSAESSYTGGYIGYNSIDSKLGVFYAKDVKVTSSGGYTGGFAGYNDGLFDFTGAGFNHILTVIGSDKYTGGMVGYNDSKAYIKYAVLSTETSVEGNDYVGWLFGYNKGQTEVNNAVDCSVNVKGANYVGGLSGGDESLENNYKVVDGSVVASGNYVGGIFGSYNKQAASEYMTHIRDVNVSGKNYVGGCFGTIGKDSNPKLMIKADNIQVSGANFVSGLVPVLHANQEIGKYFEHNEQIEFNSVSIDITNVDAQDGYAGIVTALNNGYIHEVDVKYSTITAADNCKVGIVSGLNNRKYDETEDSKNGIIDNVLVEKNTVKYTDNNCAAGFVVGVNNGIIQNSKVYDNNFEIIDNQLSSRNITKSYLGEIAGINGSTEVLDMDKMAIIQNCDVNNLVSNEATRDIQLTGINLGKIQDTRLINSPDSNIIFRLKDQYNPIQKQISPDIAKPEKNGENILFAFENLIGDSVLKIYGIKLIAGTVTSREMILDTSSEVTTEVNRTDDKWYYSYINDEGYDGFELYAENPMVTQYNNITHLPSEEGMAYFFDIPLSEVEMEIIQNQDNGFIIKYAPLNGIVKNYIQEYLLYYKIDDGEIQTLTFNDKKEIALSDLSGHSVIFGVTAKPNDESYFYSESPIKWSEPYEMVDANVLSELSITEQTENLTNQSLENIEISTETTAIENEVDNEND